MATIWILVAACLWLKPLCLAGQNIPLTGKPTNQTGAWGGLTSEKAIDGMMYNTAYGNKYCAHPDNTDDSQPAEWWIDLEQSYFIHSVTLYNTGDTGGYWRMENFAIRVYNPSTQSAVTCAVFSRRVSPAASVNLTCPSDTSGQYVQFIRLGGSEIDKVTICEVKITGQLYPVTSTGRSTTLTPTPTPTPAPTSSTSSITTSTPTPAPISAPTPTSSTSSITTSTPTPTPTEEPAPAVTPKAPPTFNKTMLIIVVASVIGSLIIAIIIGIVLIRRRNGSIFLKNKLPNESQKTRGTTNPGFSGDAPSIAALDEVSIIETEDEIGEQQRKPETSTAALYNEEENPYTNSVIPMSEFESYVNMKKSANNDAFDEFKTLPPSDSSRCKIAITDDNKKKNRFLNIYPYDSNLVPLIDEFSNTEGDYINASFIMGYGNKEKVYIATQGPVHQTMVDFWRMIWQYDANKIVMITNLVENGKRKCDRYWPEVQGQPQRHGPFTVVMLSEKECADYVIRTMMLTKGIMSRELTQYHFTSWKDKGKPQFGPVTLVNFYRRVHADGDERTRPLIVHCSAGVGRTGTFIAFDILQEQMGKEQVIDVYGCVQRLRQQRMLMVQTKDQYEFLHEAILEVINVASTAYSCTMLSDKLKEICEEDENGQTDLERQFLLLRKLIQTKEDQYKEGLLNENKDKNRDTSVIPGESDRPYLTMRGEFRSHYINAVYVDSYKKHSYYVVTQMPLPDTQIDLWRLIFDHKLKSIVMINELDESDASCQRYWPEQGSQTYGPIKVEFKASDNILPNVVMREFSLSLDESHSYTQSAEHCVRQYQLLGWPNSEVFPPDKGTFLSFVDEVNRFQDQQKDPQECSQMGHMLVHCLDGVTHSGLFCGTSHIVGQIMQYNEVDALLAARYVCRRRQQFFRTKEELKFLYDIALEYMSRYHTYANFN